MSTEAPPAESVSGSDLPPPPQQPPSDPAPPPAAAGPAARPLRRRRRVGLGIQSKLLIMLLAVSLISAGVVGVIGYLNGRESLQAAAFDQLTTIRELRANAIEREFATIQRGVVLDSRNESAVQGATALVDGFAALQDSTLTAAQDAQLDEFYDRLLRPGASNSAPAWTTPPRHSCPATAAGRYLQANYVAGRAYDDYDAGLALNDAGDGSAWSAANAKYGPYFTGLVEGTRLRGRAADRPRRQRRVLGVQERGSRGERQRGALHRFGAEHGQPRGAAQRFDRPGGHHRLRALPAVAERADRLGDLAGGLGDQHRRHDGGPGARSTRSTT